MTYLVLGSSGLIGISFSNYLIDNGDKVILWDNKLDLRDIDNLDRLEVDIMNSNYVLFDLYDTNFFDIDVLSNNLKIMLNVFSVLGKHKTKKLIFVSSHMSNLIDNEYGVTKRLGEFYCNYYNGINVRLWNVYGHEEETSIKYNVVQRFVKMALETTVIKLRTNGEDMKQFVYDSDCAEALFIIFKHYEEFKSSRYIDIASGNWITIKDVAIIVKKSIPDTSILKSMFKYIYIYLNILQIRKLL